MFSGPMQDWITNDGNGTTPFVQSRSGWMDLAAYGDVTFWLDVRSVSPPGAGSLTLTYETSPTMDESAFKSLASITLTTSPNPSLTHVALASNPGLGRYVRWKLTGTAAGISYIESLTHQNKTAVFSGGKMGEATRNLLKTLKGIQYGTHPDPHSWMQQA